MFKESNYNEISINAPAGGMNRNISPEILPAEFSYYLENLLPYPLGELNLRNGTDLVFNANQPLQEIVEAFPFRKANGDKQIVLYTKKYVVLQDFINAVVLSSASIRFTSPSKDFFEPDTYMTLTYQSVGGTFETVLQIVAVTNLGGDTIALDFSLNSLPSNLTDFYVLGATNVPDVGGIEYVDSNSITIDVPNDYNADLYYSELQNTRLVIENNPPIDLVISNNGIDTSVPGKITFIFNQFTIPNFTIADNVTFSYQSFVPNIASISYSIGFLQVYDFFSNQILVGAGKILDGLSLTTVPRSEFQGQFGRNILWIYNGVNPIMTWDGNNLEVYKEFVKEFSNSFNRIDATHFSFISNANFDIDKYFVGNSISLNINGASNVLTVSNIGIVGNVITITTIENLPMFAGNDAIELFYSDQPPAFSFIKSVNERLYCLGPGNIGLNYRSSEDALRMFYSFRTNTDANGFRFFKETIKAVPSINMAATHENADNFEAIASFSGKTAIMGRTSTQIWTGYDPTKTIDQSQVAFRFERLLPVGIVHGNLLIDMENDVSFITNKGCASFSTLNIGNQVMVNPLENVDPLIEEYIKSISTSNLSYRACRSFKYKNGGFAGFKIGFNKILVSLYKTSLYSWSLFSGDFSKSSTYLTNIDDSLYLFILYKIYRYADGVYSSKNYGDQSGQESIKFMWTSSYLKKRWANKFIQIYADYPSDFPLDDKNYCSLNVVTDLRKSLSLSENYLFEPKGDPLGSVPFTSSDLPSSGKGLRFSISYAFPYSRLKFQAKKFWVFLQGQSISGPLSFKNIKLYGVVQR
jgi:hypothetical protein